MTAEAIRNNAHTKVFSRLVSMFRRSEEPRESSRVDICLLKVCAHPIRSGSLHSLFDRHFRCINRIAARMLDIWHSYNCNSLVVSIRWYLPLVYCSYFINAPNTEILMAETLSSRVDIFIIIFNHLAIIWAKHPIKNRFLSLLQTKCI